MATRRRRGEPAATPKPKTVEETEEATSPKISRKSFLEALSFITSGIASDSIIEQSDLVMMDETRLVSYNDEIAVSHPYEIGYKGGVSANELYKLLQKLPTDEIEIGEAEEENQNQLVIRCEAVEAIFFVVKDVAIPELGIDEIDGWIELPPDFCHGVEFCVSSASTDTAKGVLTCINVKGGAVMSCDNFQATRYELKAGLPKGAELNIPKQAAKELSKYNPKEVALSDNWIHFRNDAGTVFSARVMSGEYPEVEGLFENVRGKTIPLPKDLKKSLGRVEILADEDSKFMGKVVNIEIANKEILCRGQGSSGKITEKIKTPFKDEIPPFAINPALLSRILEVVNEAILTEKVLLFSGQGFDHVIALISQ